MVDTVAAKAYKKVGVIATKATTESNIYRQKLKKQKPALEVVSLATPLLAPMIEEGYCNDEISDAIIEKYLSDPSFQNIDALLLACTHYPLIRANIERYFQRKVEIFDSTDIVAKVVEQKLLEADLLNNQPYKPHQFYVSDYTRSFEETTRIFYQKKIDLEYCPIW